MCFLHILRSPQPTEVQDKVWPRAANTSSSTLQDAVVLLRLRCTKSELKSGVRHSPAREPETFLDLTFNNTSADSQSSPGG